MLLFFLFLGEDILCLDGSDRNTKAKDGVCPTTAIKCTGRLIRPLTIRCQYYIEYAEDYPDDYEDFDFESECNEELFICIEANSPSKCDLNPHCVDGEDEIGCKEEYITKGIFHPEETFECDYPSYTFGNWTLKTERAIRCDKEATCPNGEDEKNCKPLIGTIKYIVIRK